MLVIKKLLIIINVIIILVCATLIFRHFKTASLNQESQVQNLETDPDTLGATSDEAVSAQNNQLSINIPQGAAIAGVSNPSYQPPPTPAVVVNQLTTEIIKNTETVSNNYQSLTFADGLSQDGATVRNADKGSSQQFFKTINIFGKQSLSATMSADILTFKGENGIILNSDPISKTLTVSQSLTPVSSIATNSASLNGFTWNSPDAIGANSPNKGVFTDLTARNSLSLPSLSPGILHVNSGGAVTSSLLNLRTDVTNNLSTASGGTGLTTFSGGDLMFYASGSSLSRLPIAVKNSVLTSSGTAPVWSTSLALPGTLSVTGESKFTGRVGIGTTPQSGFHVSLNGDRAIFQMFSGGSLSPLNLWNSSTSATAGSGMLFGAGSNPQGGFIGGMLSQRIDAASNSRTALRVLSNGSLTDGEAGAPFYIEGSSKGVKLVTTAKFGMGTTNPAEKLHVNNGNIRIDTGSLCVSANGAGCTNLTPGKVYASNTTVQSADIAENYISSEKLEPGDLVMPEGSGNTHAVIKTKSVSEESILGVISTKPGVTLGSDAEPDKDHPYVVPIALSGRVPVKVSGQNGSINIGDSLTSSSVPGVAMKAGNNDSVIGKALEAYKPENSSDTKLIMVYINLSWKYAEIESPKELTLGPDLIVKTLEQLKDLKLGDIEFKNLEGSAALSSIKNPLYIQPDSINGLNFFKGILTINTSGDIKTSGTILARKILIEEKSSDSSVGSVEMPSGQNEVIVKTSSVTEKSRIFVSPNKPVVYGIIQKKPGESFTIQIEKSLENSISFDWWIIN